MVGIIPPGKQYAPRLLSLRRVMNKFAAVAISTVTLAVVVMNGGVAQAKGGGGAGSGGGGVATASGTWPAAFPLPTDPGTLLSQSSTTAVVRSTDPVGVVQQKLDDLYITTMGCIQQLGVNKPRDYVCTNPATGTSEEVLFTFAALDPKATDPSVSQTNAFLLQG
jgi:hypothetical protein